MNRHKHIQAVWWRSPIVIVTALAGLIAFYFFITSSETNDGSRAYRKIATGADLPPGGNKATLILGNGTTLSLDTVGIGQLAMQGTTRVIKTDSGELVYASLAKANAPDSQQTVVNNMLTVPRGGQFRIVLPDGTKVWLNAGSSISYPTMFKGKEKTVTLKGEAYFEINDLTKLFVIKTYRDVVKARLSSFNVSCYDDERFIKTSCVSGTVSVGGNKLNPDEAYENGLIIKTDAAGDIAWSKGIFDFDNVFIEDAMRRISRWYAIDVVYDMGIPVKKLSGEAARNLSLKQLLGRIDHQVSTFQVNGNALYVRPLIK